ncbi:MAG: ATP synthase F1 subunit epsilon [Solirubrobacterales bacterium]
MAEEEHLVEVEVVTPEGAVYEGQAELVSTRTTTGEIGIKARHIPILARLRPTTLRVHTDDGDVKEWAQAEGYIQVFANRALVLIEEAIEVDELDSSELEQRISDAEEKMEAEDEDSAAYSVAQDNKERAEAFLELAKS